MRSLSILLCGYGWFAGIPEGETNNAELIARALDGETLVCGDVRATVRGMTMPVLWRGAFEPVQAAIDAQKPDLVLALGTDARAGARIRAERQHEVGLLRVDGRLNRLERAAPEHGHGHAAHRRPHIAADERFAVQCAGNQLGVVGFALRNTGKPAVAAEQNGKGTHEKPPPWNEITPSVSAIKAGAL